MTPTIFANTVMLAQDMYEHSWNSKSYTLNHLDAARAACRRMQLDAKWAEPIAWLNSEAWNDVQLWAKKIGAVLATER